MMLCKIREMEQERKTLDDDHTLSWTQIIKQHQTNYESLKLQFEQKRRCDDAQCSKKKKMLKQCRANTDTLKNAQNEIHSVAVNAVDLMNALDEQSVQIKNIKQNVAQSNNLLDNMSNTIKKMKRRWWA